MDRKKSCNAFLREIPRRHCELKAKQSCFAARDKLRNSAVRDLLKKRDCRVAPLLAMTAVGVFLQDHQK
jgi:hypothetical protein